VVVAAPGFVLPHGNRGVANTGPGDKVFVGFAHVLSHGHIGNALVLEHLFGTFAPGAGHANGERKAQARHGGGIGSRDVFHGIALRLGCGESQTIADKRL